MLLLITWGLLGLAASISAQNKNRNSTLWFILGILGGVFALIAIAVLPPLGLPPT